MELIKENIEYEKLLGEHTLDNMIKEDYVIPDVQPDVQKILALDAKAKITGQEVMQNKIFVEGQIRYNLMYLAKSESNSEVHNAIYTRDFSSYIEMSGARADMTCEAECNIEHIECNIINERKISIEGIMQLKGKVNRKLEVPVIKDVEALEDIQLLKNPSSIDKVIGVVKGEIIAKSRLQVPMEKAEIGKIIKCDVTVHKGDTKLLEGKVQVEGFAKIQILYKASGSRELASLEEDIFINNEIEASNVNYYMESNTDFRVKDVDFDIKEDDLGENRIVDVEAIITSDTKVMHKEEFNMIEDAYSPSKILRMEKKNYDMDVSLGQNTGDIIVKENLELPAEALKPVEVLNSSGKVTVTDKKILEDKVQIEGIINAAIIFKTNDEDNYVAAVNEQVPFSCLVDMPGAKIDMDAVVKVNLESLDAYVEASTIAIKALIKVHAKVTYKAHKEFLEDIVPSDEEVIKKKSSITIYIVQDGDTLWKIAKKYFATVEDLLKINDLEGENISVGQKLIIPGRAVI